MEKFENVNVINVLKQIVKQNTSAFSSDFKIDEDFLRRMAASHDPADKVLLFMSRNHGTYCFREYDVLLLDSPQYTTWQFYAEHPDHVLAYSVVLGEKKGRTIYGTIYPLNYKEYVTHISQIAVPADNILLRYQNGARRIPAKTYFDSQPYPGLGDFTGFEYIPNNPLLITERREKEARERAKALPGNVTQHIRNIRDAMVNEEYARIRDTFYTTDKPNSPNGTHYMVSLSSRFQSLASSKDMDHLFELLPFQSLNITSLSGNAGLYATISEEDYSKLLATY